MRYLKYFESNEVLCREVTPKYITDCGRKMLNATDKNLIRIKKILPNPFKINLEEISTLDGKMTSVKITLNSEQYLFIDIYSDEYFILCLYTIDKYDKYKIPTKKYYEADGWDGLKQAISYL